MENKNTRLQRAFEEMKREEKKRSLPTSQQVTRICRASVISSKLWRTAALT